MIEVQLLIPVASNAGATFTPEHHLVFETFVLDRFGGLSRLPGTTTGKWIDEGIVFDDQTITYVIALKSITQGALIAEVVTFAKGHYGQLAIYLRYLGVSEIL